MARPRNKDIRRYEPSEKGSIVFDIEDVAAEVPYRVTAAGNVYVGAEFAGLDVKAIVLRRKKSK